MRVAFGHFGYDDDISGVTTWLVQLMEAMVARGWEVHCIVQFFGRKKERSEVFQRGTKAGVQFHWIAGRTYTDAAAKKVVRLLDQIQADMFLPQVLIGLHYGAIRAQALGLPFVYTMHSDDPLYWGMLDELCRMGFRGPVVCVSEFLRTRVLALHPDLDARVISYGVTCDELRTSYQDRPFRVAFCGRLEEEQKRISAVARSMVRLCQTYPAVECRIIGDGKARPAVEQMVQEAGLQARVQLLGRLPNEIARHRLAECQALLLLSDYEGLPLAVLEAMSMGVVPICRNIDSGIPEIIKNGATGYLVVDEEREVEAVVGGLLKDPAAWTAMSHAGRSLIEERFSKAKCNEAWIELVQAQVKSTHGRTFRRNGEWKPLPPVNPLLINHDFRTPPMVKRIYRRLRRLVVERR